MQLTHYDTKFKKKTFPIILVCDSISNALNIGSLFRTADAFGVEKLIFCGEHIALERKITKSSRATEKFVSYELRNSALEEIKTYKDKGFQIISLEITRESTPIHKMKFPSSQAIILVVGAENYGVSQEILELSDAVIHIDMYGRNSSMNVVQASNIALYEITKHYL